MSNVEVLRAWNAVSMFLCLKLERDIQIAKPKQTYRYLLNYAFVQRLNFCSFADWWWIRFYSCTNRRSWSRGSCRCRLTRLPNMPQPLHCPVQPLQSESLTVEEQNRIILLVILTDTFKAEFGLPMLVVLKFYRNSVVLVLMERPSLVLVNWSWLKFI